MTRIVCQNTWAPARTEWDEFVAEATARGDANRIPAARTAALALIAQGMSGFTVAHTIL